MNFNHITNNFGLYEKKLGSCFRFGIEVINEVKPGQQNLVKAESF